MVDEQKLSELRRLIDAVDEQIVTLLNERARLSLQAGIAKGGDNIQRPERKATVLENVSRLGTGPLSEEGLRTIFKTIIRICRTIQLTR